MKIVGQIPRVNGSELSYAEFREKYMMRNEPVILTGLMDGWRACTDWVSQDGRPNLSFFSQHCGNSLVQVSTFCPAIYSSVINYKLFLPLRCIYGICTWLKFSVLLSLVKLGLIGSSDEVTNGRLYPMYCLLKFSVH